MKTIMDASSDDSIGFSCLSLHDERILEGTISISSRVSSMEDSGYSSGSQNSAGSRQRCRKTSLLLRDDTPDSLYWHSIMPVHISKPSRTLEGQKHIDIIVNLCNYPNLLKKVLSELEPDDLVRCCLVSKEWNKICKYDKQAFVRRKAYLSHSGLKNKENMGMPDDCFSKSTQPYIRSRTSTPLAPITAQRQINFCVTPVAPLPDTPVQAQVLPSRDRFSVYYEEGRKLGVGRILMPCPRCTLPSRVDKSINVGQCSEPQCRFQFCLTCLCEQHITSVCPASQLSTCRPKWPRSLTSRSSRRKLRRL